MISTLKPSKHLLAICIAAALSLTACGGGGGSSSSPTHATVNTITGVVASGTSLHGYVYIKDAAGLEINVPIGDKGIYSADVSGMLGPFIVRVIPTTGPQLYSIAPVAIAANVTQLTTLSLFLAIGMGDLETLYGQWASRHAALTGNALIHAQAAVNANFQNAYGMNGLDYSTFNIFTAPFNTDGTGYDAVLDWVGAIQFDNGQFHFTENTSIQFNPSIDVSGVSSSSIGNSGSITNSGTINAGGTMTSSGGLSGFVTLTNGGTITNTGTISAGGAMTGGGFSSVSGSISPDASGSITNSGTISVSVP